jgi:hypothetical protein
MTNLPIPAPTQTVYPWKAALRTGIQVLLSALVLIALIGPLLADFIEEQFPGSPVVAWIVGAVAFCSALGALIARIMALPQVNVALTAIGLGATPKS